MAKRKKRVLLNVETSRGYGRDIIRGVSQYLIEHSGWTVYLEDRGLQENHDWVKNWRGDGIISRTSSYEMAALIAEKRIPTVEMLGDGKTIHSEVPGNEKTTAYLAAEHLIDCQLKNFAFFAYGNVWWGNLRGKFFQEALAQQRFSPHLFPGYLAGPLCIYPQWEAEYDQMLPQWLKQLPKPVGLWAVNDFAATRINEACENAGVAVPEEIALLGTTNDTLLCNLLSPPLSSIDLNSFQAGYMAAKILDAKMSRKTKVPKTPVLIPPIGVVKRQSTDVTVVTDSDVAEALRYIRTFGEEGLSVVEVAKHVGLSQSTLERRFREHIKRTPEKEILRIRIKRVQTLLLESDFPLRIICKKTGFATPEYLIQAFRRETGMTPKEYRSRLRKE
ncbi:MAG: substrate-binding domain-containing protein [Planctomycetaceae bacterium]|nr:substrate-binding domain-containing protein [Planctomycetaceae bacterium]